MFKNIDNILKNDFEDLEEFEHIYTIKKDSNDFEARFEGFLKKNIEM